MANYTCTRQPPDSSLWKLIWKAFEAIGEVSDEAPHYNWSGWDVQSKWLFNLLSLGGLTLTKIEQKRVNKALHEWVDEYGKIDGPSWNTQKGWLQEYITVKGYIKR